MFLRSVIFLAIFSLLTFITAMAQKTDPYADSWAKVDEFIKKGLPKSASEEADKIYRRAKQEDNQPQLIKALVYKSQLVQQVEEDDWYKNVTSFEKETAATKEPGRQILHSILAQLYWNYFQTQRWKIYDRSTTIGFEKDDPETWSAMDFHQVIKKHFDASLVNPAILQQTKLDHYEAVLNKGNQRRLRPTLYDLLVNEALDYYKTDEENITRPANTFILNDQASLAPAKIFIRQEYKSTDSINHEYQAIQLYQDWIRFHLQAASKEDIAQLIDADIARIQYAYTHQKNEGKEQLYKEALEHIYTQYKQVPEAQQAGYLLAMWWKNKGDKYVANVGTQTDKYAFKQALQLAEEVSKAFPESEGGIHAYNLVMELKRPSIATSVEKVNIISSPFRALVTYKNTSLIYLRLIAIDDNESYFDDRNEYIYDKKNWEKLAAVKPLRSWQQALPAFDDLRDHSTEIKVDGLPPGKYMLLSSASPAFSTEKNPMASSVFYVSNIAFVNSGNEYFILHRESGQPLAGASAQVYTNSYDYSDRKNILTKAEMLKTDAHGYLKITLDKQASRNIRLDIRHNNDRLFLKDEQYNYRMYYGDQPKKETSDWDIARYFIFTDRAIYRPGQKVHFKALGVLPHAKGSLERGQSLFIPDRAITVQLKDANYQTIDSLRLKANEYGSIKGSFILPETGLTGNFSLYIDIPQGAAANFKVEEYKRPKFFVASDTLSGSYTINDSIHVTGTAKAYAGNAIDGATVKYRVHRQTRFLYPWLLWSRKIIWPPYARNNDQEITSGETTTDIEGKYRIVFKALPDLDVDKSLDPGFDYTIDVDITDINGETRSSSQTVSVGYKSMLVAINIPGGEQQDVDSLKTMSISTTNLAGKHVTTQVAVKVWRLKSPSRLIRERYWQQPDTAVMTEAEYIKYFPHDEYANESDPRRWAKEKLQFEQQLQTTEPLSKLSLEKKWQPGWYLIEATARDKNGEEIKSIMLVALHDYDKNIAASPGYSLPKVVKETIEPGEEAVFIQGTNAPNVFAIQQITRQTGKNTKPEPQFEYKTLNQTFTTLRFPAKEEDRGGYAVNLFFIKDNRVYINKWMVHVPWTNKQLNISFETFRDKLLPGQEETWKVKISGYKGDAVAAEMLASMYDASLDQFEPHNWNGLQIWNQNYNSSNWNGANNFTTGVGSMHFPFEKMKSFKKDYDQLIGVVAGYRGRIMLSGKASGLQLEEMRMAAPAKAKDMSAAEAAGNAVGDAGIGMVTTDSVFSPNVSDEKKEQDYNNIQIRSNFNETAFFFPDLHTNEKGEISFSFTIPEALTQWKLQTLAHTKDLATAFATRTVQTQKKLMVQPNAPRFFRQGDHLTMQVKIVNMSSEDLQGRAQLHLLNSSSMANVDTLFDNKTASIPFQVKAGQSVAVAFPISIPMSYTDAVSYRITATAGDASDGEEMVIPVLTNRMLVTESFPINLRNTNNKTFTWNKLLQSGSSSTLQNKSLTVEYSSNPVWYAVQALPYLMEYPYDCAEQIWNRYYANALASKIANSMPKIKAVFEQWKNVTDTAALLSNLQKNLELKAVLLEETPWVLDAKNEAAQKKNIALLFDMVKMSNESSKALNKLSELQTSNGGFSWFKGGPDDRYMTQYILSGIGHLQKLEALPAAQLETLNNIVARAVPYLDQRLKEDYDALIKQKADLSENRLTSITAQYLYMRSFFGKQAFEGATVKAYEYFKSQAKTFWTTQPKYEQGMMALALFRSNEQNTASAILKSLVENSISNEEFGMYWKEFNTSGYYWWQAPIESHALLIEAFSEIEKNNARVDDLKTWLLKQKQTNNWRNTKATAEACYALLLQGNNWLNKEQIVNIKLGDTNIQPDKAEAGTGYFKETIAGENVKPAMGNITVKSQPGTNSNQPINQSTSWGAVYWQYFEDLDKITTAASPLSLKKQLFVVRNSDRGPVLAPVNDKDEIKVGDRVKVRVELRSDRNLEYVHLKDMRASCFEPVNVLSQYKYQGGLGYYEATKDASTNFFISHLSRGTYVFEYEMLATHSGEFSNGISSIQCMYAPEFSSHSEGIRVKVK